VEAKLAQTGPLCSAMGAPSIRRQRKKVGRSTIARAADTIAGTTGTDLDL